jgi:hypothetical protein
MAFFNLNPYAIRVLLNKLLNMKKLAYLLFITASITFTACNNASQKTGNEQADSGANNPGSSGASDTSMAAGSGAPVGVSTGGSDTSTSMPKDGVANPVVDTPKQKKQ